MSEEYRLAILFNPVTKDREVVKFHTWGYEAIEGDTNVQFSVGIVETDTGIVKLVYPEHLQLISTNKCPRIIPFDDLPEEIKEYNRLNYV